MNEHGKKEKNGNLCLTLNPQSEIYLINRTGGEVIRIKPYLKSRNGQMAVIISAPGYEITRGELLSEKQRKTLEEQVRWE